MIEAKDIKVEEIHPSEEQLKQFPHRQGMRLFRASLVVSHQYWVDEKHCGMDEFVRHARTMVKTHVWRQLYGGLLEPFYMLRDWVFKNTPMLPYGEADKEFAKVGNMLADPKDE